MWEKLELVRSQEDHTVKQIFIHASEDRLVEVSYIDKKDGKDIFCVPTQTSCNLGCKFCHLTGQALPADNLTASEIASFVHQFRGPDGRIHEPGKPNIIFGGSSTTLLVSYMGSGEPLMNLEGVMGSAQALMTSYQGKYQTVRFAVASIIPSARRMREFTESVLTSGLNFKFHWSLHSARQDVRGKLMPAALPLREAVRLVTNYAVLTNNPVEAHYTLLAGENDTEQDAKDLANMLRDTPVDFKVLRYSERTDGSLQRSEKVEEFFDRLRSHGFANKLEYYAPPGNDIGASCGQFLSKKGREGASHGREWSRERIGVGAYNPRGLKRLNVVS